MFSTCTDEQVGAGQRPHRPRAQLLLDVFLSDLMCLQVPVLHLLSNCLTCLHHVLSAAVAERHIQQQPRVATRFKLRMREMLLKGRWSPGQVADESHAHVLSEWAKEGQPRDKAST